MTETNTQQVIHAVSTAVKSKTDVHHKIKDITLRALTLHQLDTENIKAVAEAVSQGIHDGVADQDEQAKDLFMHAVTALDNALAIAAEASTLAIEEAAANVADYSRHDLNEAINDLKDRESLFFDTLEKIAKDGNQRVADIINDFITHARQSGTAVGEQTLIALDALKDLPKLSKDIIVSSAVATTSTLAQIGSGILLGIAESLQPNPEKK
ncbi:MAG: hypothetical protein Q7U38_03325 [Methylobacter sp.]|nr:hypothetical protein [Methylobacter sp.]MDP2098464.1 hypothetical protein [Methylobacter sp.]MDP2427171.1 hypothetical protein [Methylobacter sp.]MDP3056678.1 hypothetical protein [Methylobacter sp.]MDP3364251.1 hypothetical protein [Methylobacter sp.]